MSTCMVGLFSASVKKMVSEECAGLCADTNGLTIQSCY